MFKFNKSERPYLWRIHQYGTVFQGKESTDMCQMLRRVILGLVFITLAPFIGAFVVCTLLEAPIQFLNDFMDPVFSILSHCIGHILYIFLILVSVFFGGMFLGFLVFSGDALDVGGRITRVILPEKGIVVTWYDGFKNKYCPRVDMRDDM